ncbi:hypothetical protein [Streptomyces sp. HUAS ZL42]|uniref:hypothetical protein n=1 Tax=Streptomyces sp. HUAS ZL42 TaxID=3231715 RepID=UPI00345E9A23
MAISERQLHEQHRAMTKDLGDRRARLKQLGPDDASFGDQYEQLVAGAVQLLEFERAMPDRLAEPHRQRSEQIVKWSWRGESAVATALIAAVFVLGHTAWWMVLLIPHLLATLLGWTLTVTTVRHKQQRAVAIALHVLCLLVALVSLGVLSAWWIIAIVVGWIAIGALSEGNAQQEAN